MKLEAIVLPVTDVDRSKACYENMGFDVDVDHQRNEAFRVVQLTPPTSQCSIIIGKGVSEAEPGSVQGLHLIVTDIEAARTRLVGNGIDISDVFHFGPEGQASGPDPERADYNSFASFSDPDGNGWLLQEVKQRAAGR